MSAENMCYFMLVFFAAVRLHHSPTPHPPPSYAPAHTHTHTHTEGDSLFMTRLWIGQSGVRLPVGT